MSTLKVPLIGTNVTPSSDSESGTAPTLMDREPGVVEERERQVGMNRNESSLHKVRFGQSIARSMERQAQAEAQANAPAPSQPSQVDALTQQVATMQAAIERMASQPPNRQPVQYDGGVIGELQRRTAEMPDYGGGYNQDDQYPVDYDPFDQASVNEYIKRESQKAVEADRTARKDNDDWNALLNEAGALDKKYGRDANYEEVVKMALQDCAARATAKQSFSLTESYERISGEVEARNGRRRRSSYLPGEVKGLGRIMEYHQQTGRAGQTKRGR